MNRRWCVLSMAAVLAACASVPRTVEISRGQLQAALDKRFPLERRLLQIFDVKVSQPMLALLPSQNRIGVELTLGVTDRVSRIPLEGFVAMSFVPRYEPSDHSIRMAQVRVDKLEVPSGAPSWRTQVERLGGPIAEAALEGAVLHTFAASEIARTQGWAPGDLRVTSTGVSITLSPPK